jgi:hypothetical protein
MRQPLASLLVSLAFLIDACAQAPDDGGRNRQSAPFNAVRPADGGVQDGPGVRPPVTPGVCDPNDRRWCRVADLNMTSNPPTCAPFWEQVPAVLSCSLVPEGRGGGWSLAQGPSCLVTRLNWGSWGMDHVEECFYDPHTGRLIAARGKDACAIYCSGTVGAPEVLWGVDLDSSGIDCWSAVRTTVNFECLPDGTQRVVPVIPPVSGSDGGARDGVAQQRDVWVPPPPPPAHDGGARDVPAPPPAF